MRIELTRIGLLVYLANHYTTRGAQDTGGKSQKEMYERVKKKVIEKKKAENKTRKRRLREKG